jgi:hypothetical protein
MHLEPEEIRCAIARTLACRTARVAHYATPDTPTPGSDDLRGTGVVDFTTRRARVTDRLVTRRGLEASRLRGESRLLRWLKRSVAAETEFYFDGGRRYVRGPDGTWTSDGADPAGAMSDQHPSWLLHVLSGAQGEVVVVDEVAEADGKAVVLDARVDLSLAQTHTPQALAMPPGVFVDGVLDLSWAHDIPARAWMTADGHIRRASVASHRHLIRPGDAVMWFASEFDELGEPVSVVPLPLTDKPRSA